MPSEWTAAERRASGAAIDTAYGRRLTFDELMERVPSAFAVTSGRAHVLVYANATFCALTFGGDDLLGAPIVGALSGRDESDLTMLLDAVFRTGVVVRDRPLGPTKSAGGHKVQWMCSVWPTLNASGETEGLIVEARVASKGDLTMGLQRDVAERLLLSALRERDVSDRAEQSRQRADGLSAESQRLTASLDERATLEAITKVSLPLAGAWCIVDLVDASGTMSRLAIIHPNLEKQALLRRLEGRWRPEPGDPFGVAAMHSPTSVIVVDDIDAVIAKGAHDPETLGTLREVGVGPLLSVPLVIGGDLAGSITFVAGHGGRAFTHEDIELAKDVAARSSGALESARTYSRAISLQARAEEASDAKSAFLASISHELRTPLNAIGGYVELLEIGLRGPVTEQQLGDLGRIKLNQRHLLAMINDILNFVRIGSNAVPFDIADVAVNDVIVAAVSLVEALIRQKGLSYNGGCDPAIVVRADRERVTQILVNLLSNAIKFTPAGGRISIGCEIEQRVAQLRVTDSGIGIPTEKAEAIFDPFVQVRSDFGGRDIGVGLGLAISRGLARAMRGDLTVESTLGVGSRFTLSLPIEDI